MHHIFHLFALTAATAFAAAIVPRDSSTPPCINYSQTYKANFDKLANNSAVPNGFAGCDWPSYSTVDPLAAGYQVNPASGALVIQTSGSGIDSYLTTGLTMLKSFHFACVGLTPEIGLTAIPLPCTVQVVTLRNFPPYDTESFGPFSFAPDFSVLEEGYAANMTKVALSGAYGSEIHFVVLTSGSSSTTLLLDSLVLVEQC